MAGSRSFIPRLACCAANSHPLCFFSKIRKGEKPSLPATSVLTLAAPRGPLPWGQAERGDRAQQRERGDRAQQHSLASPAQAAPALLSLSAPLKFCPCGCCVVEVLGHCLLSPLLVAFLLKLHTKPPFFPQVFFFLNNFSFFFFFYFKLVYWEMAETTSQLGACLLTIKLLSLALTSVGFEELVGGKGPQSTWYLWGV